MKKIKLTLLLVAALCCVFSADAGFRWGIKAGLNVDKMSFNEEKLLDGTNRCGYTAGFTAEYMVPMIGVGADLSLMYTRMQSEAKLDGDDYNMGKNFIEIPLNLKYRFSIPAISSIFSPAIYTGPVLALCLDGKDSNSFKTHTCQWGWSVGLNLEFIKHLQLSGGYTFGINNIMKRVDTSSYPVLGNLQTADLKAKNNYWTITVGWLF